MAPKQVAAQEAQRKITDAARTSKHAVREIKSLKEGEAVRQGDIYVTCLKKLPAKRGKALATRQLAPGSSQGSRHCAEGEDLTLYSPTPGSTELTGPLIVAKRNFKITHPEHAHFVMPAGIYQVTYQRDFSREGLFRVED
ncbi:MAG: hypothetical protein IT462_05090 [Planctomycetes bacterium]|nr:hypothetical protein [Planctomycetota bacterium]